MELSLKSSQDRVLKRDTLVTITSGGRVYINKLGIKETKISDTDIQFHLLNGKVFDIPYSKFGSNYGKITYEYYVDININLSTYLKKTDEFMLFLISKNCKIDFDVALKEFGCTLNGIHILLKPVYVRYNLARNDNSNLMKIKNNIDAGILPKKLVLYDVPAVIANSKLKLFNNLSIELSEDYLDRIGCHKHSCVSLGRIKKFDKVIIELNCFSMTKVILTGQGYY